MQKRRDGLTRRIRGVSAGYVPQQAISRTFQLPANPPPSSSTVNSAFPSHRLFTSTTARLPAQTATPMHFPKLSNIDLKRKIDVRRLPRNFARLLRYTAREDLSVTHHKNTKVIVVDEHALSRELFCKVLTSDEYTVRDLK